MIKINLLPWTTWSKQRRIVAAALAAVVVAGLSVVAGQRILTPDAVEAPAAKPMHAAAKKPMPAPTIPPKAEARRSPAIPMLRALDAIVGYLPKGVWLTHVTYEKKTGAFALEGRTADPDLVATWMRELRFGSREPRLISLHLGADGKRYEFKVAAEGPKLPASSDHAVAQPVDHAELLRTVDRAATTRRAQVLALMRKDESARFELVLGGRYAAVRAALGELVGRLPQIDVESLQLQASPKPETEPAIKLTAELDLGRSAAAH
jgi:Tfp pilus assembly protein PilN